MHPISFKRVRNMLPDGAGMLGWTATHEHAKMVARQLQTMLNSDREVNLLGSSRGYNKFSNVGCNNGCRGLARTLSWMKKLFKMNNRTIIENLNYSKVNFEVWVAGYFWAWNPLVGQEPRGVGTRFRQHSLSRWATPLRGTKVTKMHICWCTLNPILVCYLLLV